MRVHRIEISPAPADPERVRLSAEVVYDTPGLEPEVYWFEFGREDAGALTEGGDPWLVTLLPLAAVLGEPLRVDAPVDRRLVLNARELLLVWRCWYPALHVVPLEVETCTLESCGDRRNGMFLSGGVDSFFTLLRHNGPRAAEAPLGSPERVDEAAFLLGYDLPLEEPETYARLRDRLEPAAGEMGVRLIPVATNVRRTAFRRARWAYLSHGCVLAGVALALGGRWESALIASGETYANLQPRGSHPLTDPLLSTARTRIVHDGAGFSRVEKTDFLAGSEAVLGALRVCFKSRDEWNCGACNKCFRTMATLEAAGALDHCPTFPGGSFSLPRLRRLYSPDAAHARFMEDVAAYAERKGRPDIAGAVKESLRYSARLRRWLAPTARLKTRRGWRRLGRSLERLLMSGAIG